MAVNQVIFLWSSSLRTETVSTLDRALTRQVIISNVQKEVDNLHKEVTLLSQVEEGAGADAESRALFNEKVDRVALQIKQLRELADPLDAERIYEIDQTYA